MIREFKLEGYEWKGKTDVVRTASFTSGFDIDEITQIGWFRFMEAIVSMIVLYKLFDLEPAKPFECRSDI